MDTETPKFSINVDLLFGSFQNSNESSQRGVNNPQPTQEEVIDPIDLMILRPRDKFKI